MRRQLEDLDAQRIDELPVATLQARVRNRAIAKTP